LNGWVWRSSHGCGSALCVKLGVLAALAYISHMTAVDLTPNSLAAADVSSHLIDCLNVVTAGGAHGKGQKLLEEVGPGVSLESLAVGRASFQSYLERCNTQAGMLAAGALDTRARRALR